MGRQYRDKGLTIIGVHTPESDLERNADDVRREIAALGIKYPVVTDNDYSTWRHTASKPGRLCSYWINKDVCVGCTSAKAPMTDTEQVIKKLLAEEEPAPPTTSIGGTAVQPQFTTL